jgi:hypothetical protein
VTTSNPFGSISTTSALDGATVVITLHAAALTAIAADQNGNIFIGGVHSGENTGERLILPIPTVTAPCSASRPEVP